MKSLLHLVFVILLLSIKAHTFLITGESAELVKPGTYAVGGGAQLNFSPTQFNLIASADYGINDSSSVRAMMGFGGLDFQAGATYKWIPIPDYEKQPAIGLKAGVHYAREEDISQITALFIPIISKKVKSENGMYAPYVSIPIGISNVDDKTETPILFTLGTEFFSNEYQNLRVGSEMSLNLSHSQTNLYIYANWLIDEKGL